MEVRVGGVVVVVVVVVAGAVVLVVVLVVVIVVVVVVVVVVAGVAVVVYGRSTRKRSRSYTKGSRRRAAPILQLPLSSSPKQHYTLAHQLCVHIVAFVPPKRSSPRVINAS